MRRVADYRLIRPLGRGNHGQFFLARTPARLGLDVNEVALKVLEPFADEAGYDRVADELRLFATVRSEHLVPLLDAGHDRGRLFYATPFYPEGSLADPASPLSDDQVLRAVRDAARGAHDLHEAGVAHRDIKPSNVLLYDGGARLADLGLAGAIAPGMSVSGIGPIGSIEYMDPRLILGDRASRSTDLWSLGMTLHRALTGRSAYESLTAVTLVEVLRDLPGRRPRVDPDLDPRVVDLIDACLSTGGDSGPTTAEELAAAIDTLLGEPPP